MEFNPALFSNSNTDLVTNKTMNAMNFQNQFDGAIVFKNKFLAAQL
jgi:hypothetical protein